jgi:hypothetical protein
VRVSVSRLGLLLALLVALLGVSAAVAPVSGAEPPRAPVTGTSALAGPAVHDDLQDWLRLSLVSRNAPAQALPDSSWAVCPRAAGAYTPHGRTLADRADRTARPAAWTTPRSCRAPPLR